MKKQLSILGILLALIAFGCSSDSNSPHANIVDGQWKLVHVGGSFAGVSSDFEPGIITWDFNPTTQTVTVVNNNADDNKTDIFETGVYNYQVVANPDPQTCSEILKIDNVEMGCFSIVDGNLRIDQAFADGYTLTLAP
jgi:hypothetical protein